MMYVGITSVVLIFLNLYTATTMRNLVFRSKETSLEDKVQMAASAFSGLHTIQEESAEKIMDQLGNLNATRVLVTDASGLVLYDSLDEDAALGQYAVLPEIVQALGGNDVFYSSYGAGRLESKAATPILYAGSLIGAVYMMEYDLDQGALIAALQQNILWISVVLEGAVILFSLFFSEAFSRRMRQIFASIRIIREGDYSHKMQLRGHDELAVLSSEFNALTERLQTSEQRRRQFVSDASHELKTPLTSIKLLSDSILQNDMDTGTIREFVEDIGREAQRLSRITEDLLRLTRLDSGIQDAAYPVSVSRVLERVVRMLGVVAREKEVTLTYETDEDAVVRATEDDIHQILYNLMENGIKYSGSMGFVHTTLKTVGDTVVISVEDNGIGIPDEDMEHVFERFYRVDKNRSRAVGGTGLGLSIVSDTVRRRGGSIRAQHRQSGSGTVFIVELPLARREEADE